VDPLSVLVISEYAIVRLGVAAYLNEQPSIKSLRSVDSLTGALSLLANDNTEVLIVDLALLKPSGLSMISSLLKQDPGIKIVVLSRNEREPFITQCIENGALGYLSLGCTQSEMVEAIHTVYRNEKFLSRDVAYGYAIASLNKSENVLSALTTREYQVFAMLAKGAAIADIAAALFISPKTVHVYRTSIFNKLKLSSSYELTLLALRQGVISLEGIE
jgi:DNA-binding NarL/FixJ family response regulator